MPDLDADLDVKVEDKAAIKLEGPDGQGAMLVKSEELDTDLTSNGKTARVKTETNPIDW